MEKYGKFLLIIMPVFIILIVLEKLYGMLSNCLSVITYCRYRNSKYIFLRWFHFHLCVRSDRFDGWQCLRCFLGNFISMLWDHHLVCNRWLVWPWNCLFPFKYNCYCLFHPFYFDDAVFRQAKGIPVWIAIIGY